MLGERADNSGRVGSTATIKIDAGSRQIGGPYDILWCKKPINEESREGIDYIIVGRGEVAKTATKIETSFTVPEAAYGANYVYLRRAHRPNDPYSFMFTVVPDLKVSPASSSPGAAVTVKGTGLPAKSSDIKLSFDGNDTKLSITTNELGSFSVQFTVPETIAGKHLFAVSVENMSLEDTTATLEVRPRISLSPPLPEIGTEATLKGQGFAANSAVTIKYDDMVIAGSPSTNQLGSFSHSFKVPESSREKHVITVTDKAGNTTTYGLALEGEPPPAPNPLYPCQGERFGLFGAQVVTFRWEDVSDPSGVTYTLELGTNIKVWPPTAIKSGLTTPTCIIRLEPGTYYWRVKAIDGAGNESGWEYAPLPIKVGLFSLWYLVLGGIVFLFIFILILRAFFRRLREYLK